MSYLVIARKYRPRTFGEVAGQPAIATTIQNAIRLDRIAHAYLFAGPRGVGKTSLARILAQALCCKAGPTTEPCGSCERCGSIQRGNDLDVVEIDAASNRGIDDIRDLRDKARVAPMQGDRKLYIVDEVHQLTSEAFNALLKILEEPPSHVIFVLATTEPEKIPDTIRSRCQCFEFSKVSDQDIVNRLETICQAEELSYEKPALAAIARAARGGMRDSQSLLDQVITHDDGTVTLEGALAVTGALSAEAVAKLLGAVIDGDVTTLLSEVDRLDRSGVTADRVVEAMLRELRELLVLTAAGEQSGLVDSPERLAPLVERIDVDRLLAMTNLLVQCRRRLREHDEPRLPLELSLLRMARLAESLPIAEAVEILRGARPAVGAPSASAERRHPTRAPHRAESAGAPAAAAPGGGAPAAAAPGGATAAAPPAAAPPGGARSLPDNPKELLNGLVRGLLASGGGLGPYLGGFEGVGFDGEVLRVAAKRPGPATFDLQDPKVRRVIAEVSTKRFGRAIALKETKSQSDAEAKPGAGRSVVDRATEMFDGQVIE